jgi:hypothetical protein
MRAVAWTTNRPRRPCRTTATGTGAVQVSTVAIGIPSEASAASRPATVESAPVTTSAWQRASVGSTASRQTRTPKTHVPLMVPSPSQVGSPSVQRAARVPVAPLTSVTSMQSVRAVPPPRKRTKGPV